MKTKTKKIVSVLLIIFAIVFIISGLENRLRNNVTRMESAIFNLYDIINNKAELYGTVRDEMEKYPQSNEILVQIDSGLEKLNNKTQLGEFNKDKYNEIISNYKKTDESIDKLIILFDDTKEMNDNTKLKNAIKEYSDYDIAADSIEKMLKDDIANYNKSVKRFPTNIIAKFKKLSSINEL